MRLAKGKQEATIDGALKAIDRFERLTGFRSFKSFHIEQAKAFRDKLLEQPNARGKGRLSAATMTSTLRNLKAFFIWLAERPGYKSRISFADAEYFTPTAAHARIAGARREIRVPNIEQFEAVITKMPAETLVNCRDRAIVAFLLLSGARDGSIPTFKLKHVDLTAGTVSHDARDVKTKGAETFPSVFFPVGELFLQVVMGYVERLKAELLFGPDDPLFPAPQMGHDAERGFVVAGYLAIIGATPRRSAASSALPLKPPASNIPTRTRCAKLWRAWESKGFARRRSGKPGHKSARR